MIFQYPELGLMCGHLNLVIFFSKTKHSKCFKYKKLTNDDQFLNKTDICPVLNASKVPLTEVETLLLFKGVNFRPTLHDVVDKSKKRIPEHFPNA